MKRYANIPMIARFDGRMVFKTTHYPTIPQQDSDVYVVTNEGDYLDTLAYKFYKDPTLWWIIALANNIGKGRMSVEGGLQIRIPTDIGSILSEFGRLNS